MEEADMGREFTFCHGRVPKTGGPDRHVDVLRKLALEF